MIKNETIIKMFLQTFPSLGIKYLNIPKWSISDYRGRILKKKKVKKNIVMQLKPVI